MECSPKTCSRSNAYSRKLHNMFLDICEGFQNNFVQVRHNLIMVSNELVLLLSRPPIFLANLELKLRNPLCQVSLAQASFPSVQIVFHHNLIIFSSKLICLGVIEILMGNLLQTNLPADIYIRYRLGPSQSHHTLKSLGELIHPPGYWWLYILPVFEQVTPFSDSFLTLLMPIFLLCLQGLTDLLIGHSLAMAFWIVPTSLTTAPTS